MEGMGATATLFRLPRQHNTAPHGLSEKTWFVRSVALLLLPKIIQDQASLVSLPRLPEQARPAVINQHTVLPGPSDAGHISPACT